MKTFKLLLILLVTATVTLTAQPPQAMKYKAIAKDEWGVPLPNKNISIRFTIYQGSEYGTAVYSETHQTTTDKFGLMDVNIGQGSPSFGTFSDIDWGADNYYIQIELDPKGGTDFSLETGSQQLLSVPYAFYAGDVFNDGDNDTDPQNELITNLYLNGTYLEITEGGTLTIIDLSGLQDGNEDADADPTNEIQDLQLADDILTITGNGTATEIDLSAYLDDTDTQLTEEEVDAMVADNGYLTGFTEVDGDVTNEIQDLSSVLSQGADAGNKAIVNISQQGIGTATPNASAALEISSTTQGFLPPRMTNDEMNAITPTAGLMVYNTTINLPLFYNGSEWRKLDGSETPLYIGQNYAGGIIFYIDGTGIHGLVCAESDQSTGAEWGCFGTTIPGADGTAVGTGAQNTIDIEAGCTDPGTAADICANLSLNGYDDWFLPSKDELNLIYSNLYLAGLGGLSYSRYWSSTEENFNQAWCQFLQYGTQSPYAKITWLFRVRAVRAF